MKQSNKRAHCLPAFTLVEVLVTTAIVSIAATIFLVGFSSAGRIGQQLENAAREVGSVFREAQNYALAGYQGQAGTEPCGFRLAWSGAAYSITYRYKDGAGACTQSAPLKSYSLKDNITFTSSDSLDFTLPHAAVSFGGASKAAVLNKGGINHVVCVYSTGLINNYAASTTCP